MAAALKHSGPLTPPAVGLGMALFGKAYRGRFAPSPTGLLHFGSLVAALISYLDAKAHGGTWLLRIEDIDPPREQAGASASIIESLERHGLIPDEPIQFQSEHREHYENMLKRLRAAGAVFHCPCSRRYLSEHQGIHRSDCQKQHLPEGQEYAVKFRANQKLHYWHDALQGMCGATLDQPFVLKRRDGLYAYQLAVVSDDIQSNITQVVRGADLLESTPQQLAIYEALSEPAPNFLHFAILLNKQGQKLSKQNYANPIDQTMAAQNIKEALRAIGLYAPGHLQKTDCLIKWGTEVWNRKRLLAQRQTSYISHLS